MPATSEKQFNYFGYLKGHPNDPRAKKLKAEGHSPDEWLRGVHPKSLPLRVRKKRTTGQRMKESHE